MAIPIDSTAFTNDTGELGVHKICTDYVSKSRNRTSGHRCYTCINWLNTTECKREHTFLMRGGTWHCAYCAVGPESEEG